MGLKRGLKFKLILLALLFYFAAVSLLPVIFIASQAGHRCNDSFDGAFCVNFCDEQVMLKHIKAIVATLFISVVCLYTAVQITGGERFSSAPSISLVAFKVKLNN